MARCDTCLDAVPTTLPTDLPPIRPSFETIRDEALQAGAIDPMILRFRVLEVEIETGRVVNVQAQNVGFRRAVELTNELLQSGRVSHYCLEPVGFLQ